MQPQFPRGLRPSHHEQAITEAGPTGPVGNPEGCAEGERLPGAARLRKVYPRAMNRIHESRMLYGSTGNPVQDFLKKIFGKNPCVTPYVQVGLLCR